MMEKPGAEAGGLGLPAENAISHRVEGAAPEAAEIVRHEVGDPLDHLARGFVGKSEQQDAGGAHAILHQVGHAVGERARLAAAGPGDDERGAGLGGDGRELLRVQLRRVVDLESRTPPPGSDDRSGPCGRRPTTLLRRSSSCRAGFLGIGAALQGLEIDEVLDVGEDFLRAVRREGLQLRAGGLEAVELHAA